MMGGPLVLRVFLFNSATLVEETHSSNRAFQSLRGAKEYLYASDEHESCFKLFELNFFAVWCYHTLDSGHVVVLSSRRLGSCT